MLAAGVKSLTLPRSRRRTGARGASLFLAARGAAMSSTVPWHECDSRAEYSLIARRPAPTQAESRRKRLCARLTPRVIEWNRGSPGRQVRHFDVEEQAAL